MTPRSIKGDTLAEQSKPAKEAKAAEQAKAAGAAKAAGQTVPPGRLFLVGTPIGNLRDITLRALDTLKEADLIAAEDTRHTQKLLNHFEIKKPMTSYFEHNKRLKGPALLEEIRQGKNIVLVSDAGMPGISDPGSDLVGECLEAGIEITVIPGVSALLTGLVASGLDTAGFVFLGFFPRANKDRKKLLSELQKEPRTMVFYESPHRIVNTLDLILQAWGDRRCCVARELTKIHEEYERGFLSEVLAIYRERTVIKGEITAVIAGEVTPPDLQPNLQPTAQPAWGKLKGEIEALMAGGTSRRDAVREVAGTSGVARRELYNRMIDRG